MNANGHVCSSNTCRYRPDGRVRVSQLRENQRSLDVRYVGCAWSCFGLNWPGFMAMPTDDFRRLVQESMDELGRTHLEVFSSHKKLILWVKVFERAGGTINRPTYNVRRLSEFIMNGINGILCDTRDIHNGIYEIDVGIEEEGSIEIALIEIV